MENGRRVKNVGRIEEKSKRRKMKKMNRKDKRRRRWWLYRRRTNRWKNMRKQRRKGLRKDNLEKETKIYWQSKEENEDDNNIMEGEGKMVKRRESRITLKEFKIPQTESEANRSIQIIRKIFLVSLVVFQFVLLF